MLDFVVVAQIAHRLDNLGDTRLVVGTEQRVAVGHDDVLALVVEQLGKLGGRRHDALAQHDVSTVIVLDDAGLDVGARAVHAGVVVGNEADGGHLLLGIGLEGGVDVAHLVHLDIRETFALQLFLQVFGKHELLGRAWHSLRVFGRLGVKLCIIDKPLY